MDIQTKYPLGQLLREKNLISEEQLQEALLKQKESTEYLGQILLRSGFIDEESEFLTVLSEHIGVPFISLKEIPIDPEVISKVPAQFALFYKIIPIDFQNDTITIATGRPLDIHVIDAVGLIFPGKIKTVLASEKDILETIRTYYGIGAETVEKMIINGETESISDKAVILTENIEDITGEATVSKLVNQIILAAHNDRATDIHIESFENDLSIRYRIDGVLLEAKVPAGIKHFKDAIISRLKVLSKLNIAERRLPQDGRLKVKVGEVELDLRISFLPTLYGENAVIRILNSAQLIHLEKLGLSKNNLALIDDLIKRPHGIIFVTGPTGSGKTTTLYSCLARVNTVDKKILTIEDPVEYQLRGITQIQIYPLVGLTFASGLRSMLRHDPDIMMVGEVRDSETAQIAIQVALTGHLVFSTLHTNDAASGITRLLDMGIEPYLISSAVECFVAQRLVRLICPKCKGPEPVTNELSKIVEWKSKDMEAVTLFEGRGCGFCKGTGYYGREAIYELLVLDEEIRQMIMARAPASLVRSCAIKNGMKTLHQDGWDKIRRGLTTLSEVIRVTQSTT